MEHKGLACVLGLQTTESCVAAARSAGVSQPDRGVECLHITFRAIGAPGGGSASSPSPAPAGQTPVVHVDARLVVIDVVVTGKQGRLLTGLKKGNFAVKDSVRGVFMRSNSSILTEISTGCMGILVYV